ncbi:MAG: LysM peptidoglycan-binding domain-containing protein [Desulfatiglandaceae bacterium]
MNEKKENGMESLDFSEEMEDDMTYTRPRSRHSAAFANPGFPIKWMILGAAAFLFLIVISLSVFGGGSEVSSEEFDALTSSVEAIQKQVEQMENISKRVNIVERQEAELRNTLDNMNQTLGTVSQRLASLTQKFESSRDKSLSTASPKPLPSPKGTVVHEVKAGETLYGIAIKYNTTTNDILRMNKLGGNATIHPGQKLVVKR